jgi:hypothetical protein
VRAAYRSVHNTQITIEDRLVVLMQHTLTQLGERAKPHKKTTALLIVVFVVACAGLVAAASHAFGPFGLWVSEPRVDGAVVDKVTRQPLEGAIIAGYYVTTRSKGHGPIPVAYPKLFEAITDANGRFSIPGWKSDALFTPGWRNDRFLTVIVYRPGYQLGGGNGGGSGMRDWRMSDAAYETGAIANMRRDKGETIIDWTNQPAELVPARNDYDRFVALEGSGMAYGGGGKPCDWESYARIIQVQHWERKNWIKRNVPANLLKPDGYANDSYTHPDNRIGDIHNRSRLDRLIDAYDAVKSADIKATWNCSDPRKVFDVSSYAQAVKPSSPRFIAVDPSNRPKISNVTIESTK